MIKITTTKSQITDINNATLLIFGFPYCEEIKHIVKNEYVIPLSRLSILTDDRIKALCPFITNTWLGTNIYNEVPEDWLWIYDKTYRVLIPAYLAMNILVDIFVTLIKKASNDYYYDVANNMANIYSNNITTPEYNVLLPYITSGEVKYETKPSK